MLRNSGLLYFKRAASIFALAILTGPGSSSAQAVEKAVYRFPGGRDGADPFGALIADQSGTLYGTTAGGGRGTGCNDGNLGCGTVFRLTPKGREAILYSFKGGADGAFPRGSLTIDAAGNLYGTTTEGGRSNAGTVFRLGPDGKKAVLYAFTGGIDGDEPTASLVLDASGNLYGATYLGGNKTECNGNGCGVVFEINPSGQETVLYTFTGGSDGAYPTGGVIRDNDGNIYGATGAGGLVCENGSTTCGTVFELAPNGSETVLYAFQGGKDGLGPNGPLFRDASGNFYGTTFAGGGTDCGSGCGTVFEVVPGGNEIVLYSFKGGDDGSHPFGGVVMDGAGNFYGTTFAGGGADCHGTGGCGTVFELAPDGTETILCAFHPHRGRNPEAGLFLDNDGVLYGTTTEGGTHNNGVVFRVKP